MIRASLRIPPRPRTLRDHKKAIEWSDGKVPLRVRSSGPTKRGREGGRHGGGKTVRTLCPCLADVPRDSQNVTRCRVQFHNGQTNSGSRYHSIANQTGLTGARLQIHETYPSPENTMVNHHSSRGRFSRAMAFVKRASNDRPRRRERAR